MKKGKEINSYMNIKNRENTGRMTDSVVNKSDTTNGKKIKGNQSVVLEKTKPTNKKVKKYSETLRRIEEKGGALAEIVKDKFSRIKSVKIPGLNLKKEFFKKSTQNNSLPQKETAEKKKIILPKVRSIYETDFDRLYDVLQKENIATLSQVAEAFNVNKEIAQRWGETLSENELIDYHIPAFGEPEFRKKGINENKEKKVISKKKKVIINLTIIGVFLLVIGGFFIIRNISFNNDTSILRLMPPTEKNIEEIKVSENIKNSFSGNGSYICRGSLGWYYIKDQFLRVESIDKKAIVVIKSGFMYTYDSINDKWIKTEAEKGIVLPGSGKLPKEDLNCKESEFDYNLFNVPEGKIA